MIPATLFGAPLGYESDVLTRWMLRLDQCWIDFSGRPPSGLQTDLELLRPFFSAGANAKSLRSKLTELPVRSAADTLPMDLALRCDGRMLITPEGRVLIAVLKELEAGRLSVITESQALWAHAVALESRTRWGREWVEKQLGGNLSPAVLGAAFFLLVNGSIGLNRAFRLPVDEVEDRQLARVVLPVIGVFSERLGGDPPATDTALRSHWVFTQVSRLLPFDIARVKVAGGTGMYVREGRETNLVDNLNERLGRFGGSAAEAALLALVAAYRDKRGALTVLDQSFEEPRHTKALFSALSAQVRAT